MLTNSIDSIREEKARFARDVEYIKETFLDDILDQRVEVAESLYVRETMDELEEAADMITKLSSEDDIIAESAEVNRILNADGDISFNEMVGIE